MQASSLLSGAVTDEPFTSNGTGVGQSLFDDAICRGRSIVDGVTFASDAVDDSFAMPFNDSVNDVASCLYAVLVIPFGLMADSGI